MQCDEQYNQTIEYNHMQCAKILMIYQSISKWFIILVLPAQFRAFLILSLVMIEH